MPTRENILVAVDGSAEAGRALDCAAELAKVLDTTLIILHVVRAALETDQELKDLERMEHNERTEYEIFQEGGREIVAAAERAAQKKGAPRVEALIEVGDDVAELILRVASAYKARTIMLGRRGRGRVASIVLGSVSYKITHISKLPVVIVP